MIFPPIKLSAKTLNPSAAVPANTSIKLINPLAEEESFAHHLVSNNLVDSLTVGVFGFARHYEAAISRAKFDFERKGKVSVGFFKGQFDLNKNQRPLDALLKSIL